MNRDVADITIDEHTEIEPESVKRTPAVEYGQGKIDIGYVDRYEVFDRIFKQIFGG